jgi:hypothetical protein
MPLRTIARITAFSPGQSPPPVNTPIFIFEKSLQLNSKGIAEFLQHAGGMARNMNETEGLRGEVVTMGETREFRSYAEFFDFYLAQHSEPANRWLHAIGTTLGLAVAIAAFATRHPWYALLWPVVAYAFAWTGHFVIEKNKPATFGHPWWSLISDFRMLGLMVTGRLGERLRASGHHS